MGKAILIYVTGLSLIVGTVLYSINARSLESFDTYTLYFARTMAHNAASAGANIGTQRCLEDPNYETDMLDQSFGGGQFSSDIQRATDSTRIVTVSKFPIGGMWIRDTVIAVLKHTNFSKYGWFTESEKNGYVGCPYYGASDWKITGDSVFGPAHTNSKFNLAGRPYFNDKVTATNAPTLMSMGGQKAPIYNAGYQWGITVSRPLTNLPNLLNTATSQGGLLAASGNDVGLNFFNDGNVAVRIPPSTGAVRNDTVPLATLAPVGIIVANGSDLRIQGTYAGKVTVVALKGSTTNKGNVWIDGNGITAAQSPRGNPLSPDMLGIVAEQSTYISRNDSRTSSSVLNIEASVYCHNGELTAYQFWQIGLHGRVNLFGGVTQKTAGSLGVFNSSGIQNGFFYSIRHDQRFLTTAPPHFPASTKYELASWWEK
jgi:hypothetical protein